MHTIAPTTANAGGQVSLRQLVLNTVWTMSKYLEYLVAEEMHSNDHTICLLLHDRTRWPLLCLRADAETSLQSAMVIFHKNYSNTVYIST